jgi:hypothetical protein
MRKKARNRKPAPRRKKAKAMKVRELLAEGRRLSLIVQAEMRPLFDMSRVAHLRFR